LTSEAGNTLCAYNYGNTSAFSPESTQINILNNFEYKFSDRVTLFSSLRANRNMNLWNMAPNAGAFTIPQAIAAAKASELYTIAVHPGAFGPGRKKTLCLVAIWV
jgi:iron complex outermembrane receptor protein